jgi:urea carboxylase
MEKDTDTAFSKRTSVSDAVAGIIEERSDQPRVVYRMSGSDYLLLEYGEVTLDLNLRVRIHLLEQAIKTMKIDGILELAPGVRSVLIHYDGLRLPLNRLIEILKLIEKTLPSSDEVKIPSRRVFLPIACHDHWTKDAIVRYMGSIRQTGPYLPDNMEFIARCNGLSGVDEVIKYLLATEYLVIGLGDVYLGAPCAVPLDPRYRMVVPKYNPARTWTPEGTVGLGGAFMCIYPMESPGGYQLVGRTLPIWNTWQTNKAFKEAPWLLRPFDRVKFELVSESELEESRNAVLDNKYEFRIEEGTFDIKEYNKFIGSIDNEAKAFKEKQQKAAEQATIGY